MANLDESRFACFLYFLRDYFDNCAGEHVLTESAIGSARMACL